MTHSVPERSNDLRALAERQFEAYLPSTSTGYVRALTPADASHEGYIKNGYGFFASDGNLLGSATCLDDIVERVYEEGFIPFQVH